MSNELPYKYVFKFLQYQVYVYFKYKQKVLNFPQK